MKHTKAHTIVERLLGESDGGGSTELALYCDIDPMPGDPSPDPLGEDDMYKLLDQLGISKERVADYDIEDRSIFIFLDGTMEDYPQLDWKETHEQNQVQVRVNGRGKVVSGLKRS